MFKYICSYQGVCNGQTGYFPSNYLEKIPERGAVLRCLYDYQAQRPDELTISAGQVLSLSLSL